MSRPSPKIDRVPLDSVLPAPPEAISAAIEAWFATAARDLPWRRHRTPWRALVSELMLQQTQVARVEERFEAFMTRFPGPRAMAEAGEDAVLTLWEGLGYYRRARLLHAAAVRIVERHGGEVPGEADELLNLPGVGRYTAGSVASIAFGRREPIVDGNVARVIARLAAIDARADDADLISRAWSAATELVQAAADPGGLNEGLMELGATLCTPTNPSCQACPCRDVCVARRRGLAADLPRPKSRPIRQSVHLDLVLLRSSDRLALVQRSTGGLWGGLWQPPGVESTSPPTEAERRRLLAELGVDAASDELLEVARSRRLLTHREVHLRCWSLSREVERPSEAAVWIDRAAAASFGMANPVRALVEMHGWVEGQP
jgi:A/G-specific adenine glycosylase